MDENALKYLLCDILADIDAVADEYEVDPYALCEAVLTMLPEEIRTWKFGGWEVVE